MEKKISTRAGDPWVLEVQQWLNQTYRNKAGYNVLPEDGKTGWTTVFGLIRALQIELGLSPADNFGDGTKAAWDAQVTNKLKEGWKHKIVKILDGAFRVKGFGDGKFTETFDNLSNGNTIKSFKTEAGFNSPDATFNSMWAKAVFDMSAFRMVSGGNSSTRQMQQTLNRKYSKWTGILPCDGIYQRATNTALIYGIQVELGLGNIANGNFGPSTQSAYQNYANQGLNSYPGLVLLVQYGLYQNVKDLDNIGSFTFTSNLDSATKAAISGFQTFMKLQGVQSGYPDLRTMMSISLSNGDPTRPCSGCDTSQQLSTPQIQTLKNQGYSMVGRYLTGTVGSDFRPKALSRAECLRIFQQNMSIFAIYQDNIYIPKPNHFNSGVGFSDARKALAAARTLGIPQGETIYFAIDVDCQDAEIVSYVIPYFKSISEQFLSSGYNYGVYGTRNVCRRVEYTISANPPKGLFVSNMSSGFSGNLGFPQPKNWTFDQYYEIPGGIGSGTGKVNIDKVATSGKDNGFSSISGGAGVNEATAFAYSMGLNSFVEEIAHGGIQADSTYTIPFGVPGVEMKYKFHVGLMSTSNYRMVYDIVNGEVSSEASVDIENAIGRGSATNTLTAEMDSITAGVRTGQLAFNFKLNNDGSYEGSVVVNSEDFDYEGGTIEMSAEIGLKINPNSFTNRILNALDSIQNIVGDVGLPAIVGLGLLLAIGLIGAIPSGLVAALSAVFVTLAVFFEDVIDQIS